MPHCFKYIFLCLFLTSPVWAISHGQSVFLSFSSPSLSLKQAQFLEENDIRGLMIMGNAVQDANQVSRLVRSIKKLKTTQPILVAIDQEGGRVSRLKKGILPFPSALILAKKGSVSAVYEQGRIVGATLAGLGIDINFAPVADVQGSKKNTVIGDRSYGSGSQVVDYSLAFAAGMLAEGLIPVFKHFPGHGRSIKDSHVDFPVVTVSKEILKETDIRPFKAAIELDIPMIMTAHVKYPKIDAQYPATLSKVMITDILKGELGFKGKVITDDVSMTAISGKWTRKEAIQRALDAGVDYVLVIVSDFDDV